jgi:hypothetical protein
MQRRVDLCRIDRLFLAQINRIIEPLASSPAITSKRFIRGSLSLGTLLFQIDLRVGPSHPRLDHEHGTHFFSSLSDYAKVVHQSSKRYPDRSKDILGT